MQDIFVTKLHINRVRHLTNIDIALSNTERKHLILTGKNGSGKTSLLEAVRDEVAFIQHLQKNNPHIILTRAKQDLERYGKNYVDVFYSRNDVKLIDVIFAYIPAARSELALPEAIELVDIINKTDITDHVSSSFLKYILFLDYQLYGAMNDKDKEREANLLKWFDNFTEALQEIYACKETHLHVELQKRALPFLTRIFPNVQFVVTTHSPFVVTSLSNAVVYSLEN